MGRRILQLQHELIDTVNLIYSKLNTPSAAPPIGEIIIDENFLHPILPINTIADLKDWNQQLESRNYADQIVSKLQPYPQ
jgi:hypothetical protein